MSIIQLRALQVNEVALQKPILLLKDLTREIVELIYFLGYFHRYVSELHFANLLLNPW